MENSLKVQLQALNQCLNDAQKEFLHSKDEYGTSNASLFAQSIQEEPILANFYPSLLEAFNGSFDPMEHIVAFRS